jgi:hypothetical protein
MSQIILPGNNSITLCPAAVMKIVEEHINSKMYGSRDDPKVRVTRVKATADTSSFEFSITTDPEAAP